MTMISVWMIKTDSLLMLACNYNVLCLINFSNITDENI